MLTCASCGTENPAGHRFCGACASPLPTACPSCGTPATPGFRFCGACGSALDPTPAPAAAPPETVAAPSTTERRVCSVLFADLVGFTPLSEARDPEEVRELLSRYFDTARTVITRYGGVIEKFIGDAVMAVWGTPVATEGDAERAVRAGLDLVAAISLLGSDVGAPDLRLRAGVVTGEVAAVLDAVGEGMVAGDAVNTAARVQASAEPGTVWVDSATQRLAGAAVGFTDAGEHALKGKADPQRLWQATRVLSSVGGAQRVDGLEAPMVGRDAEDRTLRELFHAAAERRTPRVVTVSGAAGSGKSRLGWEFEKYVDGLADEVRWHRGRCLTYGEGVAYWALAEAVRQRFGIAAEDPIDDAAAKLVDGLATWVPLPEERAYVGVRLGRLLGLPHPADTGTPLSRDELFAGWRLFFERLAETGPVVLLVEDAHRADETLLDFVEHLVDWARQSPLYLVLLGRDELVERRPSLVAGRNRTSLTLDPLDERSMTAMAEALVPGMPAAAVAAVVGQAEGNPLFLVETVRSLIDRDVVVPVDGEYRLTGDLGELHVPDTLHALLAARLDTLDPALRVLLADAAVLGSSFPADALAAVSHRSPADVVTGLAELVRRDVLEVSQDPLSPERGQYVFRQNLLRQVAYDTLARRDRRARHLAVAQHLRRVFANDGEEMMDVIAQHYLDALAAVPDATDAAVRGLAFACLGRAADRAVRAGAPDRAAACHVRAAELVTDRPLEQARRLELAQTQYAAAARFDDAVAAGGRARDLYLAHDEQRAAARVLAETAGWLNRARRQDEALAACETALETLSDDPDVDTVEAMSQLAHILGFRNDSRAHPIADQALALAEELDVAPGLMARVLLRYGTVEYINRHPVHGTALLSAAARFADRARDRAAQSLALNNLATPLVLTDQLAAVEAARTATDIAIQLGDRYMINAATLTLCEALFWLGRWDEIVELTARAAQYDALEDAVVVLAVVRTLREEADDEHGALDEMRSSTDPQDIAYAGWVDLTVAAADGDHGRALEIARRTFDDGGEAFLGAVGGIACWMTAARDALDHEDVDEARRLVDHLDRRPAGEVTALLRAGLAGARARLAQLAGEDTGEDAGELFVAAVAALRTANSPYHLALGLLDHATYLADRGADVLDRLAEATELNAALRVPSITRRIAEIRTRAAAPSNADGGASI